MTKTTRNKGPATSPQVSRVLIVLKPAVEFVSCTARARWQLLTEQKSQKKHRQPEIQQLQTVARLLRRQLGGHRHRAEHFSFHHQLAALGFERRDLQQLAIVRPEDFHHRACPILSNVIFRSSHIFIAVARPAPNTPPRCHQPPRGCYFVCEQCAAASFQAPPSSIQVSVQMIVRARCTPWARPSYVSL